MICIISPFCYWLHKNQARKRTKMRGMMSSQMPSPHTLSKWKTTTTKAGLAECLYHKGSWTKHPRAGSWAYPFHRIIHWHQSLKPFAMKNVCEFHVDGRMESLCALHNPVFVHIGCIVITRSSANIQKSLHYICFYSFGEIFHVKHCEIIFHVKHCEITI